VATGSKLLNSGAVGPDVNAMATVGETISAIKLIARNAQIMRLVRLFLIFEKNVNLFISL
jgi:hypothetical protein